MGLACVQLFKIDEAAQLFEEARAVLEQECGANHPDTLGVYSNLAAIYDAMGRYVSIAQTGYLSQYSVSFTNPVTISECGAI
jgi:hypothetical protein